MRELRGRGLGSGEVIEMGVGLVTDPCWGRVALLLPKDRGGSSCRAVGGGWEAGNECDEV